VERGARELLDEVRVQHVFGTWVGQTTLSRLVPEVGALGLPFVFDNFDQVGRVLKGPVGALIEAKSAAKGFIVLGWLQLGPRHVTNSKKPIKTLGDLKGLKIRVQVNDTQIATFRALGANPIAMDIKDLYVALRQHDIDGMDAAYSLTHQNHFYENLTYLSDTSHFMDLIPIVVSSEMFVGLQPPQQKAIREAAAIAVAQQWKMAAADEASSLAKLKELGLKFEPVSPATRAALRKATAVVVDDARKRFGDEVLDGILAARKPAVRKEVNRLKRS
jgi:TRAP-type transport system periplasmic protein